MDLVDAVTDTYVAAVWHRWPFWRRVWLTRTRKSKARRRRWKARRGTLGHQQPTELSDHFELRIQPGPELAETAFPLSPCWAASVTGLQQKPEIGGQVPKSLQSVRPIWPLAGTRNPRIPSQSPGQPEQPEQPEPDPADPGGAACCFVHGHWPRRLPNRHWQDRQVQRSQLVADGCVCCCDSCDANGAKASASLGPAVSQELQSLHLRLLWSSEYDFIP